jgi:hypothetical protein
MGLPRGPARAPPGFVICLSRANPLKVPFTMSVTIDTARLRLCGVPLMVTFVGSTVWSICRIKGPPQQQQRRRRNTAGNRDEKSHHHQRMPLTWPVQHHPSRRSLLAWMSAPVYVCRALIVSPDLPITLPTMLFGQSTVAVARFNPCAWPACAPSMIAEQVLKNRCAWVAKTRQLPGPGHVTSAGSHVSPKPSGLTGTCPNTANNLAEPSVLLLAPFNRSCRSVAALLQLFVNCPAGGSKNSHRTTRN